MHFNIFISVVLVITVTDKTWCQQLQLVKPFPRCQLIPLCADGSQPMNGRCDGAEINDCFCIQCSQLPVCMGRYEKVFLENECCPRCRGPSNNCSNVSCFRPRRFCDANEDPIPSEACCPVCTKMN